MFEIIKVLCIGMCNEYFQCFWAIQEKKTQKVPEPPVEDVLDLLVTFAKKLDDSGVLQAEQEPVSASASSSKASSTTAGPVVDGCKPKAGPPLQIPMQKGTPTAAVAAAVATPVSTSSDGFAKGLPMPVDGNYKQNKLVVTPNEMKQFLYGSKQAASTEDHVWEIFWVLLVAALMLVSWQCLRMVLHGIYDYESMIS